MIALLCFLTASAEGPVDGQPPELKLNEGWGRVLVANRPLYPGDVVRQEDLYAVQVPAENLPNEPLPPEQVVGREVTAPLFRNEFLRAEVLGEPKTDPLRIAPSRTFLLATGGEAPAGPRVALVSGGCVVVPEVIVVQQQPAVIAVEPAWLSAAVAAEAPTLVPTGTFPGCEPTTP